MKRRSIPLEILVLILLFALGAAGELVVLVGWTPPCWVADTLNYLSRSCAKDQIQSAVGAKNLEVIEITGIQLAGNNARQVEFRSRLKRPSSDDLANMVFVDSVTFKTSGHKWRLDASSLHW